MYSLIENNEDFLVVFKQQGVCIHTEDDVLGLIAQLKQDLQLEQLYPVHRLDKVTSGLVICAKTSASVSELSQLFQQRLIEKYYLAISDKKPKKKQGLIVGDMERSRRGSWKLCTTKNNPAVTQFFSYSLSQGRRLFLLKPRTGKTHQLRVALKSLGSPIEGDKLYGHALGGEEGIALHAYVLRFIFRGNQHHYQVEPSHWNLGDAQIVNAEVIKRPWELPWPELKFR